MDIKQNPCDARNYRSYRKDEIKYIVLHYTANDGDTDEGNGNYFANNDTGDTSAHYFTDEDSITQSVQDECCAFHCGGYSYRHPECRNDNALGIEMCSDIDSSGNYVITSATVSNAVWLTKYLMDKYKIDLDHVLRHYDVTGKACPEPWVRNPELWDDFKKKLQEGDEEVIRYQRLSDIPNDWGFRDIIDTLMTAGIIAGDGSDPTGNDDVIDLSHDQVRTLIFEYNGGAFDRKLIASGLKPVVNI